jgi:hypothetical protein
MRRLLTAILLTLSSWALSAQGGLEYVVRGSVADASSGRPVAAVSVLVPGQNYATVTNADGSFIIKADRPISELRFSRIGYRDARKRVGQGEVSVKMTPIAYPLKEASIVTGNPLEIVKEAVKRISDNYPSKPELLRCFYRETLQKRQRYISVNEAVSRVYKNPYYLSGVGLDRTALEKSRVIMSQRKGDTLSVRMMGGPTLAATFDAVKNRDIIFNRTDLKLYRFTLESPEYIADRLQFVISFEPDGEAEYALYYGKLYIDRETLAFSRIELSLDMSDTAKATRMMLMRKPFTLRFTPKELTVTISYRQQEGLARMDYFRSSMTFRCDWKKRLVATNYTAVNELVVTDVIEPAVPIAKSEVFRPSDILDDRAAEFLDPDYWKDYNIIEPSESLEHAVARLRK